MKQFFVLAGFELCKGSQLDVEIIKTESTSKKKAEEKMKNSYQDCVFALAFDTLEAAKNWKA